MGARLCVLLAALSELIARGDTWWVPKVPAGQPGLPTLVTLPLASLLGCMASWVSSCLSLMGRCHWWRRVWAG